MLDPGEQCDDGNKFDLDGCDSSCNLEVIQRMTTIAISGNQGPGFCVHNGNALGSKAISSVALGQLNPPLQADATNGTVNVMTQVFGLSDLKGQNASGFKIGVGDAKIDPAKGAWPTGNMPEDWDFLADPSVVNMGMLTGLLQNGTVSGGNLTAGPSTVNLTLTLGGSPAALQMNNAKIVGSVNKTTSAPGDMPANEKVAAGTVMFDTITATGAAQGLCGDITVSSLAQIPAPQALTSGSTACTEGYTYCGMGMPVGANCNSLLDVLVGGCTVFIIQAVVPTQPDVAGPGGPHNLSPGAGKKVTPPANDGDAYSAYLTFATTRARFSGEYCTATAQCQTGQTCSSGLCK